MEVRRGAHGTHHSGGDVRENREAREGGRGELAGAVQEQVVDPAVQGHRGDDLPFGHRRARNQHFSPILKNSGYFQSDS